MKVISEVFGTSGIRRVILPGLVVALCVHPYLVHWIGDAPLLTYGFGTTTLLIAEVALFGLIISSAVRPIYYVYEGIVARGLTLPAKVWNSWRFEKARGQLAEIYKGKNSRDELTEDEQERAGALIEYLNDFPIFKITTDLVPLYEMERATRLGNIVSTYETYPETRYEVDGVSLWYHIIYLAPESSRVTFEEEIATAEAMVTTSAAGAVVSLIGAAALVLSAVGSSLPQVAFLPPSISPIATWIQLFAGILVFALFHRLALPAHREAAAAFRSLTDLSMASVREWAGTNAPPPLQSTEMELDTLVEYLQFLRIPRESNHPAAAADGPAADSPKS